MPKVAPQAPQKPVCSAARLIPSDSARVLGPGQAQELSSSAAPCSHAGQLWADIR